MIFLHTTAAKLAERGFFVVAFDRRGTGFSPAGVAADYTFDRATSDINLVIERLRLREPRLLGHSFGEPSV